RGSGEKSLVRVAQQVHLHLAHGVAGQLFYDKAPLRNLEVRQLRLQGSDQLVRLHLRTGPGDHDRDADLAEVRVRHADHGALRHAGHVVEVAFDFGRVDVVAAADDQVLAAAHDGDVAALVDLADIARPEPAVGGEFLLRL